MTIRRCNDANMVMTTTSLTYTAHSRHDDVIYRYSAPLSSVISSIVPSYSCHALVLNVTQFKRSAIISVKNAEKIYAFNEDLETCNSADSRFSDNNTRQR